MKNIKKKLSLLILGLMAALFMTSLLPVDIASADALSDLFSTGQQGQSFEQYSPTESLTLGAEGYHEALTTTSDVKDFIITIVNFALGFLGIIAVIIVIYGGVLYVTAGGEEEPTQKAKKAIGYAAIGLLIVMGSFAFVNTIIRGAGGAGEEEGAQFIVGQNFGGSFNATAVQLRGVAKDIYTDFVFFSDSAEELRGILDDSGKSSLNYAETWVTKENMLSFLFSVKEKLTNMRLKALRFTETYVKVTELIREFEKHIDKVQGIRSTQSVKKVLNSAGKVDLNECGLTDTGCTDYSKELYYTWRDEIEVSLGNFKDLFDSIKKDFQTKLSNHFEDIKQIYQAVQGIEAVQSGEIGRLYEEMKTAFGYTNVAYIPAGSGGPTTSFVEAIENWIYPYSDAAIIAQAGDYLFKALDAQLKLADELLNLQSVEAHLRANVTNGNAPLVVTFDVIDSIDPAGGSIVDTNVDWSNIGGSATFEGGIEVDLKDAVTCTTSITGEISQEDLELYGPAFRQCTFKYPGTYVATVTIKSNDPTKYVAGMSSLIVKVNPPTTKIFFEMITENEKGDNEKTTVMDYYPEGIIKTDRDYVTVTLDEAKRGIKFDASATENVENFRWNFADSVIIDTDTTGVVEFDAAENPFKQEGKYIVNLEVMNKLNEIDRKIFTLDVKKIAARINISPRENIFINTAVAFDGRQSSATGGNIRSYEWKITDEDGKDVDLGNRANQNFFTYEFPDRGKYKVELTVTSNIDSQPVTAVDNFEVKSQPPVALFDYSIPDPTQPGTVHFNAGKSYDPDGLTKDLDYEWSINPDTENGDNWTGDLNGKTPVIKFNTKGDYDVTLNVFDRTKAEEEASKPYTKKVTVDNTLDVAWAEDQEVTAQLNDEGKATMNFKIESDTAIAYEIDFGDGETDSGDINFSATTSHTYLEAGRYTVEVTVYDDEDNDNSIKRRIFIGSGGSPVAKIGLRINGEAVADLDEAVKVTKKDVLTFDAAESINTDGTGRKLKYSWDFGDTEKSTQKAATHSYDELSPHDPGYYKVILKVSDENDAAKYDNDEVHIDVVNSAPTFSSIQAIPEISDADLITPVNVNMKAFGAEDDDGEITQYRWWYFDVDDPDEPLGIQITQGPTARITIGTRGKEGDEITYGFGLEVTDSDNIKVSSKDILSPEQIPELTVINGPNVLPQASFKVDVTSVFVGETVTFTSSSKDTDGKIEKYIWDVEGDGFFNNSPTDKSAIEYKYSEKNLEGYPVRLKVVDDKSGEAVSTPLRIFVDSMADPPVAAFKFEVVEGSSGKKIKFTNNSTADTEADAAIISHKWDFDTASALETADSDGDGKKDNDVDSQAKDPERLYTEFGTYTVKLTVTDNQGNKDEVTHTLTIPMANPPIAAFVYNISGGQVSFINNSTADTSKGAVLTKYNWDFNAAVDSNGDGVADNDTDSAIKEPVYEYPAPGIYQVKLTVTDNQGGIDDVVNSVDTTSLAAPSGEEGGQTGGQGETAGLTAVLITDPLPRGDGYVYLQGESGSVTFDFSDSVGPIAYYVLDKNIYYDTDGNGIENDDQDFKTTLPGTWKTNFDVAWGKTVVKLTVVDLYGNTNSVTREIKFE
ncbi:MAG: PKD domain-containing protein [Candidatus Peregrinibacteria bacterium]